MILMKEEIELNLILFCTIYYNPRPGIVRTTHSNAAIILVILRSFSEFEELPTAVYHLYAEIVRKLFVLEYLEFLS